MGSSPGRRPRTRHAPAIVPESHPGNAQRLQRQAYNTLNAKRPRPDHRSSRSSPSFGGLTGGGAVSAISFSAAAASACHFATLSRYSALVAGLAVRAARRSVSSASCRYRTSRRSGGSERMGSASSSSTTMHRQAVVTPLGYFRKLQIPDRNDPPRPPDLSILGLPFFHGGQFGLHREFFRHSLTQHSLDLSWENDAIGSRMAAHGSQCALTRFVRSVLRHAPFADWSGSADSVSNLSRMSLKRQRSKP